MKKIALITLAGLVSALTLITLFKSKPGDEQPSEAEVEIDSAARATVQRFWRLYRSATSHRIAKRLPQAADEYARALVLQPEHEDALYYLGNVRFEIGDYFGAEQAWQRLVHANPQSARAHSRLGDLYSCVEHPATYNPENAKREFERALALNREETGPLVGLGELALVEGDLQSAQRYFDAVIGSHEHSVEANFFKGYIAWTRGARELATSLLADAISHAQRTAGGDSVIGEGDTRSGAQPMLSDGTTCRSIHPRAADIRSLPPNAPASRADSVYTRLHHLLQNAR